MSKRTLVGTPRLALITANSYFLLAVILSTICLSAAGEQFLLTGVRPVDPANLGDFVRDRAAAVALGKALFWEMQTGGDGIVACASCHFNAGVDGRIRNTMAPGANGVFDITASGGISGPDAIITAADFPFHQLADPDNNASQVVFDTDDIVGSQGVFKRQFNGLTGTAEDNCTPLADPVFGPNRQVTGRNAPNFITAAFNFRNFWDGRARNIFNGVNPFGPNGAPVGQPEDPNVVIFRPDSTGGIQPVRIQIARASLASQAVGPPNNPVEMSCAGRSL